MSETHGCVDRFEAGDQVVLDVGGREVVRPRSAIAADAKEGDVIVLATGSVDRAATEALRKKIREQTSGAKGGSFDL